MNKHVCTSAPSRFEAKTDQSMKIACEPASSSIWSNLCWILVRLFIQRSKQGKQRNKQRKTLQKKAGKGNLYERKQTKQNKPSNKIDSHLNCNVRHFTRSFSTFLLVLLLLLLLYLLWIGTEISLYLPWPWLTEEISRTVLSWSAWQWMLTSVLKINSMTATKTVVLTHQHRSQKSVWS